MWITVRVRKPVCKSSDWEICFNLTIWGKGGKVDDVVCEIEEVFCDNCGERLDKLDYRDWEKWEGGVEKVMEAEFKRRDKEK